MLKPLTLVALLMATTAPMAHAQDSDDYGDRSERVEQGDDRGDPPMRDVRRGDRWAMDRDDRDDDRGPRDWDRDRDEDRDRDDRKDDKKDHDKDHDKDRDRDRAEARDRDRDRDDRGPRDRDDDRGPRRGGPEGREGRRGPPPPPPRAGFEIDLGAGQTIRVDCGDEAFARCVEAAKPIIDAARDMRSGGPSASGGPAGPVTEVPPPPADLVAPPAAGAPPPPPPAPAPAN